MNNCLFEGGCSLPSSSNEMEILLNQLKREIEDRYMGENIKTIVKDSRMQIKRRI